MLGIREAHGYASSEFRRRLETSHSIGNTDIAEGCYRIGVCVIYLKDLAVGLLYRTREDTSSTSSR